jgi:isoleucyl-tRNA synthetase
MNFKEYKQVDYAQIAQEISDFWEKENIFEKSISTREGKPSFTFYEGPPSANGTPGIHHVMARTIKDIFCRYQTLKGRQVHRKGGWDTHGLPVELQVEKELGITKEDIGKKISVEEYNKKCRETVMRFTDQWERMTQQMGYWVDMDNPYITYENNYIESVWHLLKVLYNKGYLYKGYTIQPFSPAAGTGLSSHELNQPGCYRDVKDTSIVAQFKVMNLSKKLTDFQNLSDILSNLYILAWTTTPWTLPSNAALAVGEKIDYVLVKSYNPYTYKPVSVVLAKDLLEKYFSDKAKEITFEEYKAGDKLIPWAVVAEFKGADIIGTTYEQLLPYVHTSSDGKTFEVIGGDFVSTSDGTGIVHIAPTFGADDARVAKVAGIAPITVKDANENHVPLVNRQGKFVANISDEVFGFGNEYVKAEYLTELEAETARQNQEAAFVAKGIVSKVDKYISVDDRIGIKLKLENKAFKVEKYEHSYPHCWRTDKPILYYPLDSWFIKTTAVRDKLVDLNNKINWKPESTGTGRFGNWLENLVDWNLSRSRYWGTPLPIWRNAIANGLFGPKDKMVGSIAEFNDINFKYLSNEKYHEFIEWSNEIIENNRVTETQLNYEPSSDDLLLFDLRKWKDEKYSLSNFRHFCFYSAGNEFIEKFLSYTIDASEYFKTEGFDLHRPFIDNVFYIGDFNEILKNENIGMVEDGGGIIRNDNKTMKKYLVYTRETDLIDVWFDSGAMPYAQWHYPFEAPPGGFEAVFPADFISEGVDQTRGWFFTLHAIAAMVSDSVAFKNVVSTGLVLDKNGNKMSKRLGNAIDPFTTLAKYGADPTRWYMITNAQPWDNLKFDLDGITEVRNKFFGTLTNTYNFFALYANLDNYRINQFDRLAYKDLPELDRWILSKLMSLITEVDEAYQSYEPTRAGRAIQDFVGDQLSNWYVRLGRRRFWQGSMTADKQAAYETLQHCLCAVAQLMAPIAPFYADWLYRNLTEHVRAESIEKNTPFAVASVHLTDFHSNLPEFVDKNLEASMDLAQRICSLVHSIRKANRIKVRQPLSKILIPVLDATTRTQITSVESLIKTEVNIKEISYLDDASGVLNKKVKPNFKTLGPKFGKDMKIVANGIQEMNDRQLTELEKTGIYLIPNTELQITLDDIEILTEDLPGYLSAKDGDILVALDTTINQELKYEGIAREFVNRVQNFRKDNGFDVVDKIRIQIDESSDAEVLAAIQANHNYIAVEVQAKQIEVVGNIANLTNFELDENNSIACSIVVV